ncbi:DUF488 domain-containing protein [Gimesia maris]|uniref:DUF488 domain-containing protein n=1 Tax=Gimesia maris TaxID=122 RepID=A0A3D3R285_9PLAN|nr:DUF488 family protein [Gimesia maris]MAC52116.1 DUF488 domain-containing protein [Gimesia sp.]EDL62086.1 hypothetical cytosolic protein [Gimesia maris DSM 8797]QEG18373.1 hypothetical protein GmarT_42600 [Gimesia maris]QGQ28641.1 DUF488 family protein [Gimesia maris]HCO22328.1 DUF488 domain-containing protein [Gimesia maris]|tara:strand:+ start:23013 stop:23381 length:369 start_codon:yes stop_codon:yes gene_type:complete
MPAKIQIKRIYEEPAKSDGCRILVDRLWPRGVKKTEACVDLWPKELAPSNELRKWFHAHLDQYADFVKKYQSELKPKYKQAKQMLLETDQSQITLLTAVKEPDQSHVPVLKQFLEDLLSKGT